MRSSDLASLELSEARGKLLTLQLERSGDGLADERRAALDADIRAAADAVGSAETKYRDAVRADAAAEAAGAPGDPEGRAGGGGRPQVDPEVRELERLEARADVGAFLAAYARERDVEGPEKELRQAFGGGVNVIPWPMLAPPAEALDAEQRAVTAAPATVAQYQHAILGRVFARSALGFLRVVPRVVQTGDQVYLTITDGDAGAWRENPGDELAAPAATLSAVTVEAKDFSLSYELPVTLEMRVRGIGQALRMDISGKAGDVADRAVLRGATHGPGGFLGTGGLAAPANPAAVVTFARAVSAAAGLADGIYAHRASEVRLLVGAKTNEKFEGLLAANTAISAVEKLEQRLGGYRLSANMPAPAANIAAAIAAKTGASMPGVDAVMPVWGPGVAMLNRIIDDATSAATKGVRRLTMIWGGNFAIIRAAAFARLAYKLA